MMEENVCSLYKTGFSVGSIKRILLKERNFKISEEKIKKILKRNNIELRKANYRGMVNTSNQGKISHLP